MINYFRGEYYFLSNFYEAPVTVYGVAYRNNEAAFQSQKCLSIEEREEFSKLNPSESKSKGRRVKLRSDWEEIKTDAMYAVVYCKFKQNIDLQEKLLATGNEHLEEGNSWGDKIWGTVNGVGQNRLGKILMKVRDEFRVEYNNN